MKIRYIFAAVLCAASLAQAKPARDPNDKTVYVIDGDTISIGSEVIRLKGFDAPELFSPGCTLEYTHALAAKKFLVNLMSVPWVTIVRTKFKDKYGRTLGDVLVDGKSVSEIMISKGYAVPYYTNKSNTKRIDWCDYLRNHA